MEAAVVCCYFFLRNSPGKSGIVREFHATKWLGSLLQCIKLKTSVLKLAKSENLIWHVHSIGLSLGAKFDFCQRPPGANDIVRVLNFFVDIQIALFKTYPEQFEYVSKPMILLFSEIQGSLNIGKLISRCGNCKEIWERCKRESVEIGENRQTFVESLKMFGLPLNH